MRRQSPRPSRRRRPTELYRRRHPHVHRRAGPRFDRDGGRTLSLHGGELPIRYADDGATHAGRRRAARTAPRRHRDVVAEHAAGACAGPRWSADRQHVQALAHAPRDGCAGRTGRGATPAWSGADAAGGAVSVIDQTPPRKNADRSRPLAAGSDRASGLVRRQQPLPDHAHRATDGLGRADAPASRASSARRTPKILTLFHSATGRSASARQQRHERGPDGSLRSLGRSWRRCRRPRRTTTASRALWQAWPTVGGRFSLPADRRRWAPPGVGQARRPQDARDGALALPPRHHAALHAAPRRLAVLAESIQRILKRALSTGSTPQARPPSALLRADAAPRTASRPPRVERQASPSRRRPMMATSWPARRAPTTAVALP